GNFGYLNTYVDVTVETNTTLPQSGFKIIATIGSSKNNAGFSSEDAWVCVLAQLAERTGLGRTDNNTLPKR
ncbi:MAG: hypothetical protein Q7U74_04760, partial [Saprospiraceae bacterium]|nr:hypothetical protein [Saprospiraceae bacterium]